MGLGQLSRSTVLSPGLPSHPLHHPYIIFLHYILVKYYITIQNIDLIEKLIVTHLIKKSPCNS